MLSTEYIHSGNVGLLEKGDRLHFHADEYFRDDWKGPKDFDITVRDTFLRSKHGPRIFSVEKIGPDEDDDFYLADEWTITLIPKSPLEDTAQKIEQLLKQTEALQLEIFQSVNDALTEALRPAVAALQDAHRLALSQEASDAG